MNRTDALVDVRRSLHERLIGRMDARQLDAMPRAERRLRVREEALSLLREQAHTLPQSALADVVNAVSDAVVGMGPIEFLLKDPEVTEVTEVLLNVKARQLPSQAFTSAVTTAPRIAPSSRTRASRRQRRVSPSP